MNSIIRKINEKSEFIKKKNAASFHKLNNELSTLLNHAQNVIQLCQREKCGEFQKLI